MDRQLTTSDIELILECQDIAKFLPHCKIQHPTKGLTPLIPNSTQELVLDCDQNLVAIHVPRQSGISTLFCAMALQEAIFNPYSTIMLTSGRLRNARELMQIIQGMYENLPEELQIPQTANNKHAMAFDNSSQIHVCALSENSAKGMAVNTFYIDSFTNAFHPSIPQHVIHILLPCLATGSRMFIEHGHGRYGVGIFKEMATTHGWQLIKPSLCHECDV